MASLTIEPLTARETALLRAVAQDRCEIVAGWLPELYVDGRIFCDTAAAHRLVLAGLVVEPELGAGRVPARLTDFGLAELSRG